MEKKWRILKGILLVSMLVILAVIVGVVADKQGENIPLALAQGLFSSLIISAIFYGISLTETSRFDAKNCSSKWVNLNGIGIDDVKDVDTLQDKSDNNIKFWNNIVRNSGECDFYMMGHSLYYWVQSPYYANFKKALNRVIRNGNMVRIMIHGPNNKNSTSASKEKIEKTILVMKSIYGKLNNRLQKNIQFVHIDDNITIPYMYIRNDIYTYVSVYYTDSDSKHSILVKYMNDISPIASGYKGDFDSFFKKAEKNNLFDNHKEM